MTPKWLLILLFLVLVTPTVDSREKITIGLVENVILLPWGIKLPARIDTGAATSSLDARELKVEGDMAEFRLPKNHGDLLLRLPITEWKYVRNAESRERRPIVELTLCVGPKLLRIRVTLNDRSSVRYPLILGRNVLRQHFAVDCMRKNCLPPHCPEGQTQ